MGHNYLLHYCTEYITTVISYWVTVPASKYHVPQILFPRVGQSSRCILINLVLSDIGDELKRQGAMLGNWWERATIRRRGVNTNQKKEILLQGNCSEPVGLSVRTAGYYNPISE